ncbi:MAG: GH3 auxin-responsive promoter family protein [Opitutae bacterium]|nr:GH3 auxin-responsive promoter family protein [Opitutae bacterium]
MTLAPRFLVSFWAGYCATRFARRLKALGRGLEAQQAALTALLTHFARTEFGRKHELTPGLSYNEFRQRTPVHGYDHFEPLITRMAAGEPDVLWPGRCRFFVDTAGTTTGTPRRLPVTDDQLAHYRAGLGAALLHYAIRAGHPGIFLGRHLHVGASTALSEGNGAYAGSFDAIAHLALTSWAEANLYSPPRAVAQLPEGEEKAGAIARAMVGRDVTLVGGAPAAVLALATAARAQASRGKVRMTHLQAMWPNLECYAHTGAPLGLFADELRAALGPAVTFHEIYAAAEGWFAVQDSEASLGLRLLADAGIFFEFVPLREFEEDKLERLGPRCLPLAAVQPGADYALVVTTPAGLCRYSTGDIVRFLSLDPPRLQFCGRTRLQLSMFGEHVGERELTESLLEVCGRNGWTAVNFHVAPLVSRAGPLPRGGHEWWIELRSGTIKTPTGPLLAPEIDAALAQRNPDYAARRQSGGIEPPVVRLLMPGVLEQWARTFTPHAGTSRLTRCRPDRLIADQLMGLAKFHATAPAAQNRI